MIQVDEAIEFLNAYKNGIEIQYQVNNRWYTANCLTAIYEHLDDGKLRYKPKEPTYRAYKDYKEFLCASVESGQWIRRKNRDEVYMAIGATNRGIITVQSNTISGHITSIDWLSLLNNYEWIDGSKCGIKV